MRKVIILNLIFLFALGWVTSAFAEVAGKGTAQYDVNSAKLIANQAVPLLEAGKYKEAYNFLLVYYDQYAEDNDINFLLGQASSMMGNQLESIKYYKKILSKNSDLPRVRLELGRSYAANGQMKEARQEFDTVLASSPPPIVAQHVKQFIAQMDAQKSVNIKMSLGYLYDSNVNAGPDRSIVNNGWQYNSIKRSDHATTTSLQVDHFRQISPTSAWQTGLQYSRTDYKNATDLSWNEANFYTGLLKKVGNATYSVPINVRFTNVGNNRFSYVYGITPQAQYKLSNNKELLVSISGQNREFFTNNNRNGRAWSATIGERFNLNKEQNKFIEVGVGFAHELARDTSLSDRNFNLYATYYAPVSSGLFVLVRPNVTWYKYKGDDAYMQLVGAPVARNEVQYSMQVNLIKTLGTWNYILGYVYTCNKSNIDIYSYSRSQISFQISKSF